MHELPPPPSDLVPKIQPKESLAESLTLWNQERVDLLKKTLAGNLTNLEFSLFVELCKRRMLDPFAKQIYAVKRGGNMVIQTSIDGYRLIAERSGRYLGQTVPLWCGKDTVWKEVWPGPGNPFACKIGVYKQGHVEPTYGIAYWDTYVAPGPFWQKAGPHMLSKCAEALALKKAFPEELSGLYTDDEMAQADTPSSFQEARSVLTQQTVTGSEVITIAAVDVATVDGAEVTDAEGKKWQFRSEPLDTARNSMGKSVLIEYTVENGQYIVHSAKI